MSSLFSLDVNLVIQLIILATLALGYLLVKQRRIRVHGYLMTALFIIHLISVVLFMLAPAAAILNMGQSAILRGLTIVHGALGVVVLVLSVYFVAVWRFQKAVVECFKRKMQMRILTVLWVLEIVIGIYLHALI